jgi:hypothetical protein
MEKLRTIRHTALQEVTADLLNALGAMQLQSLNDIVHGFITGLDNTKHLIIKDFEFTGDYGSRIVKSGLTGLLVYRTDANNSIVGVWQGVRATQNDTWLEQTLNFTGNTSGNPRIDLIEAQITTIPDPDYSNTITKFNQTTKASYAASEITRTCQEITLYVKDGTPAVSPVAPAVTSGRMALAEIRVPNGATEIAQVDIIQLVQPPAVSGWTTANPTILFTSFMSYVQDLLNKIGPLASLPTVDQSSIVNAFIEAYTYTNVQTGTIISSARPAVLGVGPSGYLLCDGASVARSGLSGYPALFSAICPSLGAVTISIGTPAVFTRTGHGLITGDRVSITTAGTLPAAVVEHTNYYVVKTGADTFNLSDTYAHALAGTNKLDTATQSQTGIHSLRHNPYGTADSTHFNVPDLLGTFVRGSGIPVGYTENSESVVMGQKMDDAVQDHTHDGYFPSLGEHSGDPDGGGTFSTWDTVSYSHYSNAMNSGRSRVETTPKYVGVKYYIKY